MNTCVERECAVEGCIGMKNVGKDSAG
jgi:hypothetical protein